MVRSNQTSALQTPEPIGVRLRNRWFAMVTYFGWMGGLFLGCGMAAAGGSNGMVYIADQRVDEQYELYYKDLKTGTVIKLSGPLKTGEVIQVNELLVTDGYVYNFLVLGGPLPALD